MGIKLIKAFLAVLGLLFISSTSIIFSAIGLVILVWLAVATKFIEVEEV